MVDPPLEPAPVVSCVVEAVEVRVFVLDVVTIVDEMVLVLVVLVDVRV